MKKVILILLLFCSSVFAADIITPSQLTADVNDYNPTGFHTAYIIRLSSDASRTITGFNAGVTKEQKLIFNVGTNDIILSNENASSGAANRIALAADVTLSQNMAAMLMYDVADSRWRALAVYSSTGGGGGGGAPTNATYITETANGTLSNEFALGSLGTGLLLNTTTTGVPSIYGGSTCTNQVITALNASGAGTCTTITSAYTSGTFTATAHNLLSATHGDTTAASVVRGDVIVGDSNPKWVRLAIGAANKVLHSDGTDITWQSLVDADIPDTITINGTGNVSIASITNLGDNNLLLGGAATNTTPTVPTCADSGGNHLNYSGHTFTCGTSSSGGGTNALLDGSVHSDTVAQTVSRGSLIYGNSTPKWDELVIGSANKVLHSDGTDASWQSLVDADIPNNITIDLATAATNGTTASTSTNASFFPLFVASSSNSNQAFNLGTGLTFNPSTNNLSTTTFTGALSGNATTATALAANGANCSGNNFALGVDASGVGECAQPAFSNLSGSATDAQVPDTVTINGTGNVSLASLAGSTDDTTLVNNGTSFAAVAIPNCTDTGGNHLNYTIASNSFSCGTSSSGGASSHNLLSATHSDTTAGTVARGDVITGQTASPTWTRLAIGSTGKVLHSDGTDAAWATLNFNELTGTATDAQIPDNITISLAATATALAANGANCSGNNFALGVDASGVGECAQPAFSNLSGSATDAQVPDTVTINGSGNVSVGSIAAGNANKEIRSDGTTTSFQWPVLLEKSVANFNLVNNGATTFTNVGDAAPAALGSSPVATAQAATETYRVLYQTKVSSPTSGDFAGISSSVFTKFQFRYGEVGIFHIMGDSNMGTSTRIWAGFCSASLNATSTSSTNAAIKLAAIGYDTGGAATTSHFQCCNSDGTGGANTMSCTDMGVAASGNVPYRAVVDCSAITSCTCSINDANFTTVSNHLPAGSTTMGWCQSVTTLTSAQRGLHVAGFTVYFNNQ